MNTHVTEMTWTHAANRSTHDVHPDPHRAYNIYRDTRNPFLRAIKQTLH